MSEFFFTIGIITIVIGLIPVILQLKRNSKLEALLHLLFILSFAGLIMGMNYKIGTLTHVSTYCLMITSILQAIQSALAYKKSKGPAS